MERAEIGKDEQQSNAGRIPAMPRHADHFDLTDTLTDTDGASCSHWGQHRGPGATGRPRPPGDRGRHPRRAVTRWPMARTAPRPAALRNGLTELLAVALGQPLGGHQRHPVGTVLVRSGLSPTLSTAILDSQSVKTTERGSNAETRPASKAADASVTSSSTLRASC